MNWDIMTPSELDVLVAEKVMGYKICNSEYCTVIKKDSLYPTSFSPSRCIEDAWEVVEKMRERGYTSFALHCSFDGGVVEADFICFYGPCKLHGTTAHNWHGGKGVSESSVPEAICLAALKTIENEK